MATSTVNMRTIALPTEHGGWGFTLEPVLLGLLVVPSVAGGLIGMAALAAFLTHRPIRLALGDLWRRRRSARTPVAAAFAAGYGSISAGCLIAAFLVTDHAFWQPLAAAAPLALVQLGFDARHKTRAFAREMAGPIALGSVATAIARTGGWEWTPALGLWLVIAARVVASVPLVRAQIKMARGRAAGASAVAGAQAGVIGVAAIAAALGWIPALAVAGLMIFPIIAAVAFAIPPMRAVVVGVTQLVAGMVVVILTAIGAG